MAKIFYAVEIDTETIIDSAARGLSYGYLRFITDRPIYTGTDTGTATIPTGDQSVIKLTITDNTESMTTAFQSGELFTPSNGIFKSANTLLAVRDRFTVQGTGDFTGDDLETAKGSAPAEGDLFEVTNNGSGTEAVDYIGSNKWIEDFITREGMSNPSRSVERELEETGGYGTLSGFEFSIHDAMIAGTDTPFWEYLYDNSINLGNKTIKLYAVIDDLFYQIWTGIIENNPRNEIDYVFRCKPNFKAAHKDIPPNTFDEDDFPNSIDSVRSEPAPICIGDIEKASIFNVSGNPAWVNLIIVDTEGIPNAQATAYATDATGTTITLYTDQTIGANDLTGKYLFVLAGGGIPDLDRGVRIESNAASGSSVVVVTLAEPILDTDGVVFNLASYGKNGSTDREDRWNFGIATLKVTGIVSNAGISSFKKNSDNTYTLFYYNSDVSKYTDFRYIVESASISDSAYPNPQGNNMASFSHCASNITKGGDIYYMFPIPLSVEALFIDAEFITGEDKTKLTDFDRSSYISFRSKLSSVPGLWTMGAKMWVNFNLDVDEKEFDELYFGVDFYITTSQVYSFLVLLKNYDIYRIPFTNYSLNKTWPGGGGYASKLKFYTLPNDFYRGIGNDESEASIFAANDGQTLGLIKTAMTLSAALRG